MLKNIFGYAVFGVLGGGLGGALTIKGLVDNMTGPILQQDNSGLLVSGVGAVILLTSWIVNGLLMPKADRISMSTTTMLAAAAGMSGVLVMNLG